MQHPSARTITRATVHDEASIAEGRSVGPAYKALIPDYHIREATVSEAPVIARQRIGMSQDMRELAPDEAALSANRRRAGTWLVSSPPASGDVIAGVGWPCLLS